MKKNNGKTTLEMKLMETLARKVHMLENLSQGMRDLIVELHKQNSEIFATLNKFKQRIEKLENQKKPEDEKRFKQKDGDNLSSSNLELTKKNYPDSFK